MHRHCSGYYEFVTRNGGETEKSWKIVSGRNVWTNELAEGVLTEKNIVNISTGDRSEERKGIARGRNQTRGEMVSTVWLLPSIMAIWFANGSKRRAEPVPTYNFPPFCGRRALAPPLVQLATLKCLESTFAYAPAN